MAGGINPYLYTDGNPINFIDPDGLNRRGRGRYYNQYGRRYPIAEWQYSNLLKQGARIDPTFSVLRPGNRNINWRDVNSLRDTVWNLKQRAALPSRTPPEGLIENPNRPGSWGRYNEEGRFFEEWRLDRGRPEIKRGHGKYDHIHLNRSDKWFKVDCE